MGLKILIGCEESQEVTKAFRERGFEAYSCDLQECSGPRPEWHLKMDIFEAIELHEWHLGIFFPPCTYLTVSANKWYKEQPPRKSGTLVGKAREQAREQAREFFMKLYNCKIPKVAIENPIGIMSSQFRKPDQVIQPYMFGHGETKATCLWLKGLPKLIWSKDNTLFDTKTMVDGREQRLHKLSPGPDRAKQRSKTFPGIAKAMASTWGDYLLQKQLTNTNA